MARLESTPYLRPGPLFSSKGLRSCRTCNIKKSRNEYSQSRSICKECVNISDAKPNTRIGELHKCVVCSKRKLDSQFYKDKSKMIGLSSSCKHCTDGRARSFMAKHPHLRKIYNNRGNFRQYNLTTEKYYEMLTSQGGGCSVCGGNNGKRRLSVDHDHSTGKVRALLCHPCNAGIGFFKENVSVMRLAILYIEKHKGETGEIQEKIK